MQLIICSVRCSSHQVRHVQLAYFSFPVSFLTFRHQDAVWGVFKEKQKWAQWPRGVQELCQHHRSNLGEALKAPEGAAVPYPGPSLLSWPFRSTPANATEPRCAPAPAAEVKVHLFVGAEMSARHLYDLGAALPRRRPLSPACLVEMLPLWQPDRRALPKPAALHNYFP